MKKFALLSVSNRDGIIEFARGLTELGFSLLTTSGTQRFLSEHGLVAYSIAEYTGQDEILGGRVKTLHPKIHAGILARRCESAHKEELQVHGIPFIDVVAVNLYPFEEQLENAADKTLEEMIEFIDIGGPTMLRAAAKNCESVYAIIEPSDYGAVLEALAQRSEDSSLLDLRLQLSQKVFAHLAHYNLEISKYLSSQASEKSSSEYIPNGVRRAHGQIWREAQSLRYGENPHQSASLYRRAAELQENAGAGWRQLGGKELSYNNILDADAGYRLTRMLSTQRTRFTEGEVVSIMKHLTPCGVAVATSQDEALRRAKKSDPRSHFGGIIGFSSEVTEATAKEIIADFAEIVIAPSFSEEALGVFSKRSNLRLIECDYTIPITGEIRSTLFGYLEQTPDLMSCSIHDGEVVSGALQDSQLQQDLELAWSIVAHVKSNAIVLVKDQQLIGSGAGQTSRIDSVEVALYKAKEHAHDVAGAVAASDAFFPFPDSLERLVQAGVRAVVTPNGSKKDSDVVETARQLGITLIFVPERHFRH